MGLVKPRKSISNGYNTYMSKRVLPTHPVIGLMESGYGAKLTLLKTDQQNDSEQFHTPRLGNDGVIYQDIFGSDGSTLIRSALKVSGSYSRLFLYDRYFVVTAAGIPLSFVYFDYNYKIIGRATANVGISESAVMRNNLFLTIPNSNLKGTVRDSNGTIIFTLSTYSSTSLSYAVDLGEDVVLAICSSGSTVNYYLLDLGKNPREIDTANGSYLNATSLMIKLLGGYY